MLKKLFGLVMISAALIFCHAPGAEAGYVQLFDENVMELAERATSVLKDTTSGKLEMTVPVCIGKISTNNPYTNYMSTVGPNGSAAAVIFYCNEDGSVSKINIMHNPQDKLATNCSQRAAIALLSGIGLNLDETKTLVSQINNNASSIWSNKLNRRILFQLTGQKEILTVRILAANE